MSVGHDALKPAARRWLWLAGVTFASGMGLVLLFLMTLATRNRVISERHFEWLLGVNIAVATVLGAIIVWLMVRLALRVRRRRFGSQLLSRIAWVFALVGVLPGVLIYTVSYQFVSRSIESWFDVRVEAALQAGLNVGRRSIDVLSSENLNQARLGAQALATQSDAAAALALESVRERLGAQDVVLWSAQGRLLASAGESRFDLNPQRPSGEVLRRVKESRGVSWIEGLEEDAGDASASRPAVLHIWVPLVPSSIRLPAEPRLLSAQIVLPDALVADAMAVQMINREYQERSLARTGLQRMYIGTLTLALFLSVFGAVLLAVLMGNQLLRPLLLLAEGMREVAAGDLSPKPSLPPRDELSSLTHTFAGMTADLAQARAVAQSSMAALDAARTSLQTILDNLTAAVLVLDLQGQVRAANLGAERLLGCTGPDLLNRALGELPQLAPHAPDWLDRFSALEAPAQAQSTWQTTVEIGALNPQGGEGGPGAQTLLVRGAALPNGQRLLVFDDISDMVSAQRAKAWGEVARRLAHEIKNPLTPIQLSAERLAMKLDGKLQASDDSLLQRSVKTIVDQVDAMKRLVNEFRDYARLPSADLKPVSLQDVLKDVLGLYEQSAVPVTLQVDGECPPVMADPQQVRQVLHNLIQNAQDASADQPGAEVVLRLRLSDSGRWVRLLVQDEGQGFDDAILKRAFEPYVTTKPKGTGLGLAVVRKIMDEHGGRIDLSNRVSEGRTVGAQVSLSFAVA
jgi:nitrogen fixation/metabolism regulation signal transduction histidine kinase